MRKDRKNDSGEGRRKTARATSLAVVLVTTILAGGWHVTAGNGAGEADGLALVIEPRAATVEDSTVLMAPLSGLYVFDFRAYRDDGAPFLFTGYNVEVHSIDPATGGTTTTIYMADFVTTATDRHTVRIPTSAFAWGAALPADGIAFTIALRYDGDGAPLHDAEHHLPGGAYNLATKALVAEGRFKEADRADEAFTPLFLVDLQPDGLVTAGNPILNPGFEAAATDGGATDTLGTPPWILFAEAGGPGPEGVDGQTPWSDAVRVPSAGRSGYALKVDYDPRDSGRNLIMGQLIGDPSLPGAWYGTVDTKVTIDWRVHDPTGQVASFDAGVGLYVAGPNGNERIGRLAGGGVAADDTWRTVTYDYGAAVAGRPLTAIWLSYNITAPAGADLAIMVDNVRITGALFQTSEPRNDLTDGFSTFVFPQAAHVAPAATGLQHLARLGDGTTAYVYGLAAMDYTGVMPDTIDLATAGEATFRLLDAGFLASGGSHAAEDVLASLATSTDGSRFLRTIDSDGALSDRLLVVVHSELIGGDDAAASTVVPWLHVDLGTRAPDYIDTFGDQADPASGYHSVLRNAVQGLTLADQLDQAATPIGLSGSAPVDVAADTTLTLTCPGVPGGAPCWAGPGHPVTVEATFTGASEVVETTEVTLASADGTVLRTAALPTQGGAATWTLAASEVEALSDKRLVAASGATWFSEAAGSGTIRLTNLLPTASFSVHAPQSVVKGTAVRLVDTSSDDDGTIAERSWEVRLVADPTPDNDSDTPGLIAVGSGADLSFVVPDDGVYYLRHEGVDNEGGIQTTNRTLVAVNLGPRAAFDAPRFVRPSFPVTFVDRSGDPDGLVVSAQWDLDGDGIAETTDPGATFTTSYDTPGPVDVTLTVSDDDGAAATFTRTVHVDGTAPITILDTDDPAIDGWHRGPVTFTVSREDTGGSGTKTTRVFVDGELKASNDGDLDFTVTISGEGEHVVEYQSEDLAGNVEFASGTLLKSLTVRIDSTAPEVAIVAPRVAGPLGDVFLSGDVVPVTVDAFDTASGVDHVALFVDGSQVGVDSDGSDGWSFAWDSSTAVPGAHLIEVVATDIAGLSSTPDGVLVVVAPSPF